MNRRLELGNGTSIVCLGARVEHFQDGEYISLLFYREEGLDGEYIWYAQRPLIDVDWEAVYNWIDSLEDSSVY